MSAIFGVWRQDGGPVEQSALDPMADALGFMGRDGTTMKADGPVAMGHCLFDLGMPARPPETLVTEPTLISADIRLDNRDELAEALGIPANELAKISDPALVLRAYEKWGEACAEQLLGDFAFALYDAGKRRLFCARDPFGVRPFYYHQGNGAFLFASAIPALFAAGGPTREIDPYGVASYLLTINLADDLSLFRDIRALDSGHTLVVDGNGRMAKSRYWSPYRVEELRLESDEDYIEGFRERLEQAVRARLPASRPVAATVSGGLDSSAVTAMAARTIGAESIIGFGLLEAGDDAIDADDDLAYARALADGLPGLRLCRVSAEGHSPLDGQADYLARHGLPMQNPQHYGWDAIYAEAGARGCRVMLTGVEGDWGVSGHGEGYLAELVRRGAWLTALREIRATRAARRSRGLATILKRDVIRPLVPQPLWNAGARIAGRHTWDDYRAFSGWLAREVDMAQFANQIGYHALWHEGPDVRRNEIERIDCHARWRKLEENALQAPRFGLTAVFPLLDARLIEFYLAIPTRLKMKQGRGRLIMRRATAGLLPEVVRLRPGKGPFEPGFLGATLRHLPSIEAAMRDAADDDAVTRYVDIAKSYS